MTCWHLFFLDDLSKKLCFGSDQPDINLASFIFTCEMVTFRSLTICMAKLNVMCLRASAVYRIDPGSIP